MTGRFTLKDLGQTIPLRAVREYLAQQAWRVLEDGARLACQGPPDDEGRPIVHYLPPDESYADYPLRLEDLISTLSVLTERPAVEIAAEMARFDDLAAELSRGGVEVTPGLDRQHVLDELRVLEDGALAAFHDSTADDIIPWAQIALLAVRFVRLVKVNHASRVLLWRRCDRVLGAAGLRLLSSPELVNELCRRASDAVPENLDDVIIWMRGHTKPTGTAPEGTNSPASATHAGPPDDSGRSSQ